MTQYSRILFRSSKKSGFFSSIVISHAKLIFYDSTIKKRQWLSPTEHPKHKCFFAFVEIIFGLFGLYLLSQNHKIINLIFSFLRFYSIFYLGITSSLDIGLSNWSFEFITVSLYVIYRIAYQLLFSFL